MIVDAAGRRWTEPRDGWVGWFLEDEASAPLIILKERGKFRLRSNPDKPLIGKPFPTLEAAQVAYLMLLPTT